MTTPLSHPALIPQAYVNKRQHTSAYVRIRSHTSAYAYLTPGRRAPHDAPAGVPPQTPCADMQSAYVSIRQHTSAYASIREHT
jgi:hypothetical protein